MNKITDSIHTFFKKDFKKRFLIFISIPFLLSSLYLIDQTLIKDTIIMDTIISIKPIYINQSAGGTPVVESKKRGYKYETINNYRFSTLKYKINESQIQIVTSRIFKTVKTVKTKKGDHEIQSGLNGVNGILIIACFISMLFTIIYLFLRKNISNNSQLNLIFLNIFLITIWIYSFIKFVF